MKILVACEESQAVTKELRKLGHEAYSCDITECSGGHPEWHLKQDVLTLLDQPWDMIIAFPPCTKVSNAGAKHLYRGGALNIRRYYDGMCGKALFEAIRHSDCPKIAIENPVPSKIFGYPEPTQIVQPYFFGDPWSKKTLLWIKGLPLLTPTNVVQPMEDCHRAGTWFMRGGKDRQKNRSKTPPGFARAMAEQWAGPCAKNGGTK